MRFSILACSLALACKPAEIFADTDTAPAADDVATYRGVVEGWYAPEEQPELGATCRGAFVFGVTAEGAVHGTATCDLGEGSDEGAVTGTLVDDRFNATWAWQVRFDGRDTAGDAELIGVVSDDTLSVDGQDQSDAVNFGMWLDGSSL